LFAKLRKKVEKNKKNKPYRVSNAYICIFFDDLFVKSFNFSTKHYTFATEIRKTKSF